MVFNEENNFTSDGVPVVGSDQRTNKNLLKSLKGDKRGQKPVYKNTPQKTQKKKFFPT